MAMANDFELNRRGKFERGIPSIVSFTAVIILFIFFLGWLALIDFIYHFLYYGLSVDQIAPLLLALLSVIVAKYFYYFDGIYDEAKSND